MHKTAAVLALAVVSLVISACSTVRPRRDWDGLALEVCSGVPRGVEGRVWMKAKSKEASGQFPAIVQASPEKGVRIEVTQLMGARAALIEIRGNDFKVETPQERVSKKTGSWGGIPLEWASVLFMNRIPCPDLARVSWSWSEAGELIGRSRDGAETWKMTIVQRMGRSFVAKVILEKAGQPPFELVREDPDPQDGWARRWEVRSGAGEIKVRWRDRKSI